MELTLKGLYLVYSYVIDQSETDSYSYMAKMTE